MYKKNLYIYIYIYIYILLQFEFKSDINYFEEKEM